MQNISKIISAGVALREKRPQLSLKNYDESEMLTQIYEVIHGPKGAVSQIIELAGQNNFHAIVETAAFTLNDIAVTYVKHNKLAVDVTGNLPPFLALSMLTSPFNPNRNTVDEIIHDTHEFLVKSLHIGSYLDRTSKTEKVTVSELKAIKAPTAQLQTFLSEVIESKGNSELQNCVTVKDFITKSVGKLFASVFSGDELETGRVIRDDIYAIRKGQITALNQPEDTLLDSYVDGLLKISSQLNRSKFLKSLDITPDLVKSPELVAYCLIHSQKVVDIATPENEHLETQLNKALHYLRIEKIAASHQAEFVALDHISDIIEGFCSTYGIAIYHAAQKTASPAKIAMGV